MPWFSLCIALLASLIPAISQAQAVAAPTEFTLGGFRLGTGFDKFASDPRYQCEAGRTAFADKTCRLKVLESVNLLGTPVEFMTFMFLESRLYAVTATFNPQHYATVSANLRKPYGTPMTSVPTGSAASNESETVEWRGKQSELLLRKVNMMGRSDLRLWSPDALNHAMKSAGNTPR